jgi:hypothetical protein
MSTRFQQSERVENIDVTAWSSHRYSWREGMEPAPAIVVMSYQMGLVRMTITLTPQTAIELGNRLLELAAVAKSAALTVDGPEEVR